MAVKEDIGLFRKCKYDGSSELISDIEENLVFLLPLQ